jgi:hypothetical protein
LTKKLKTCRAPFLVVVTIIDKYRNIIYIKYNKRVTLLLSQIRTNFKLQDKADTQTRIHTYIYNQVFSNRFVVVFPKTQSLFLYMYSCPSNRRIVSQPFALCSSHYVRAHLFVFMPRTPISFLNLTTFSIIVLAQSQSDSYTVPHSPRSYALFHQRSPLPSASCSFSTLRTLLRRRNKSQTRQCS